MSLEIKFELEGVVEMSRRIRILDDKTKNFKPEFQESADFLKEFFKGEVFDTEGRAIGEPWQKRKKVYSWSLLQKTGRMRRSFQTRVELLRGEIWNAVDYFCYHQSRMPRYSNLPRRVMMKLTEQLKNRIIKFFHEGIINRIKESK